MKFKNDFERCCFDAVREILVDGVELLHNQVLVAGFAPGKGVISFTGPPKKEIDVLVVKLSGALTLLISVKDYQAPAAPLSVQEWASVVRTMNEHASAHTYLGIVVCSGGFTEGCPAWAIDHNIGLIPPHKGKPLTWRSETVIRMLKRTIISVRSLAASSLHRLEENRNFYWEVYKCLGDFSEDLGDEGNDASGA
jgi:hypothetical protein